jgi:hypothetical protein
VLGLGAVAARLEAHDASGRHPPGPALLAIRPEKVILAGEAGTGANQLAVEIAGHVFRGSYHAYEVRLPGRAEAIMVYDQARNRGAGREFRPGDRALISWRPEDAVLLRE